MWFLVIALPTSVFITVIVGHAAGYLPNMKVIRMVLVPFSYFWVIMFSLLGMFGLLFTVNGMYMQPRTPPKYEQVTEPLYRQVPIDSSSNH